MSQHCAGCYREDGPDPSCPGCGHEAELPIDPKRTTLRFPSTERVAALEAELARLQGADAAWQASEARLVGICQLLGIDHALEEPERIEDVVKLLQAELAALRDQISHMDAYNQGFLAYTRGESGNQFPYPDGYRNVHWTNGYAAGIGHIGKLRAALAVADEMAAQKYHGPRCYEQWSDVVIRCVCGADEIRARYHTARKVGK